MEMELNPREVSLVEAFRRLPAEAAQQVSALTERLAALTATREVDWSDSWSDDDLKDFTLASVSQLEDDEAE